MSKSMLRRNIFLMIAAAMSEMYVKEIPFNKNNVYRQHGVSYGYPNYQPRRKKLKGWQKQNRTSTFNKNR